YALRQEPAVGEPRDVDPLEVDRVRGRDLPHQGGQEVQVAHGEVVTLDALDVVPLLADAAGVGDDEPVGVCDLVEASEGGHAGTRAASAVQHDDERRLPVQPIRH